MADVGRGGNVCLRGVDASRPRRHRARARADGCTDRGGAAIYVAITLATNRNGVRKSSSSSGSNPRRARRLRHPARGRLRLLTLSSNAPNNGINFKNGRRFPALPQVRMPGMASVFSCRDSRRNRMQGKELPVRLPGGARMPRAARRDDLFPRAVEARPQCRHQSPFAVQRRGRHRNR